MFKIILSPNTPHLLSHTSSSVSKGKDVGASIQWQEPLLRQNMSLCQNEYVIMTSVTVRVFTSSIYLLTYFSEIKNFRGAGEDLKVSHTPCEECRTPLKYNLMLIWVQITSDAEISVGNMPLEAALLIALQD